jgi:hypothetical protein
MSPLFGSTFCCEELCTAPHQELVGLCLTEEHLERCMGMARTEIKNLILKDYSNKSSVKYLTDDLLC